MRTVVTRIFPEDLRRFKNGAAYLNKKHKTKRFDIADSIHENIEVVDRLKRRINYLEATLLQRTGAYKI
jgi:hypothetical protein